MYINERFDEFNRTTLILTLRQFVEPLILREEALRHLERLLSFEEIQRKVDSGAVSETKVFDIMKEFAETIIRLADESRRKEIVPDDIQTAYTVLKKSGCPFCLKDIKQNL